MTRQWLQRVAGVSLLAFLAVPARAADITRIANPEERLQALKQSLDPARSAKLPDYDRAVQREALVATLRELKRGEELRRVLADLDRSESSPERRQQWAYVLAESYREESQFDAALAAYERVFTGYPETGTRCPEAQAGIVEVLVASGRPAEALKAARVLWEAARDDRAADRAVQRLAEILKAAEPSPARAEALLALHRSGPAGRDGLAGTADDPVPVMATLGRPDATARRQAFEAASPTLGDDAAASLLRGYGGLYAGEPRTGLACFADALRRCEAERAGDVARAVMHGFRVLRGHGAEVSDVGQFIAHGPHGPDGKAQTDDDVADPFAAVGLAGATRQPGGLARLTAAEVGALQALIPDLRGAASRRATPARQVIAINACRRTYEALVVFDRDEALAWVSGALRRETDERVIGALVRLGQSVAKADRLDLSGVRAFDATVAQVLERARRPVPEEVQKAFRQTEHTVKSLEKSR